MKYTFENSLGLKLKAVLIKPDRHGPFPVVVFSHGFDSGKDSPRSIPVAQQLSKRGIASLLIDFTGHGESEGLKEHSTVEQQTDDLKSALNLVQDLPIIDDKRIGLHGSSSGALVALNLSMDDERVTTAVLRAPRVNHFFTRVKENADKLKIPLFFIQGGNDPLLVETQEFFDQLKTEAMLSVVPGADHLFTDPANLDKVVELSVNWLEGKLSYRKAA